MSLHSLVESRRSTRAIDADRPVPADVVERLFEAARWAPSCSNMQPWRFVAVQSPDALGRARGALRRGNQAWAGRAPLLIVVFGNPDDDAMPDGKPLYLFDCGLAVENLILQGVSEGLVVHPMAGWYEEPMKEALAIPDPFRVVVVIAVGWPGRVEDLDPELQAKEAADRGRKPLAELVWHDRYEPRSGVANE